MRYDDVSARAVCLFCCARGTVASTAGVAPARRSWPLATAGALIGRCCPELASSRDAALRWWQSGGSPAPLTERGLSLVASSGESGGAAAVRSNAERRARSGHLAKVQIDFYGVGVGGDARRTPDAANLPRCPGNPSTMTSPVPPPPPPFPSPPLILTLLPPYFHFSLLAL